MILSMTGQAQASWHDDQARIEVSITAVNHRYLDLHWKLPDALSTLATRLEAQIKALLQRGRVDISLHYSATTASDATVQLDHPRLALAYKQLQTASAQLTPTLSDIALGQLLAQVPSLWTTRTIDEIPATMLERAAETLLCACHNLSTMRTQEGRHLEKHLREELKGIRAALTYIQEQSPQVLEATRQRIMERIAQWELLPASQDPSSLEREVVNSLLRGDITEEVVRLDSHLQQCDQLLGSDQDRVGKKLDFLAQEIQREANTIAAKSSDAKITHATLDIKAHVEKIREQAHNVI